MEYFKQFEQGKQYQYNYHIISLFTETAFLRKLVIRDTNNLKITTHLFAHNFWSIACVGILGIPKLSDPNIFEGCHLLCELRYFA